MFLLKLIGLVFLAKTGLLFAPNISYAEANPLLSLKAQIESSEKTIAGLRGGTEKHFQFINEKNPFLTPYSMVYLHGFSSSRQEMSPLVEDLAKKNAANLYFTRYQGHGLEGSDGLGSVRMEDWLLDTQQALAIGQKLGKQTIVIALSTGAPLAIHEAIKNPDKIAGLVLVSPNFGLVRKDTELLLWPFGEWIARLVVGKYREWKPLNKDHAYFWTIRYPSSALVQMMRAMDLVRNEDLNKLQVPVLILYCPHDKIADPNAMKKYFEKIGSRRKSFIPVTCNENDHILAGRILSPNNTATIEHEINLFIKKIDY